GSSYHVVGNRHTELVQASCENISLATLYPSAGYRRALEDHLGNATLVVDQWHCVRLANRAIDQVRRRVQNQTLGHRGRKDDPLYRIRRALLTGYERLTDARFEWMSTLLAVGDPDGEVAACFVAKELLRDVFSAVNEVHARRRMIAFYVFCADADIPELTRLAITVSRWAELIFNYHRTGRASNGRTENAHMLIEKLRRQAHGFRNLDNYRRRIIGRHGIKWHTRPVRRIRGRQPRFIAERRISAYLRSQPRHIRQRVEWASIDPWQGYLTPIRRLLPNAQVVVDHFHLIRLANQVVTEVRQRTQQEVTGHRGRKGDPLFGIRRLLLRGRQRLEGRHWQRLEAAFDHPQGDLYDEVASAWTAKELVR